jgi:hypothetical protein
MAKNATARAGTAMVRRHMEGIAGISRRAENYAGGESGYSEQADRIRDILEAMPIGALSWAQRDHLERVLSGGLAALKDADLAGSFRRREWRPGPGRPACEKRHYGWDWVMRRPSWIDHPYALARRDGGGVLYVAEPYRVGSEDIASLASLEAEGWDVSIQARFATHFPGETTAVILRKREAKA